MTTFVSFLLWVAAIEIFALPGYCITRKLFETPTLRAALAPLTGLGLTAWLVWFCGMTINLPFTPLTIITILVSVIATTFYASAPFCRDELIAYAKRRVAFLPLFGLYLLIRATDPLDFGVEAFMDMAFLTSITRAEAFPPYDPFMAGLTINYYYFGFVIWSLVGKITHIPTTLGYPLALASQFCLTLSIAYSAASSLARSRWAGALALVMVGLLGNIQPWLNLFSDKPFHYWDATRQIPGTATEFPAFIFTLGNLHPHMMGIPYALTLLIAIVVWARSGRRELALFIALFFTLAMLTNMWDFLAYAAVALAFALAHEKRRQLLPQWLGALTLAGLMSLPFHLTIHAATAGLARVSVEQMTPLSTFLTLYGPFLLAALWVARDVSYSRAGVVIAAASIVVAFLVKSPAVSFLFTLAGWSVLAALENEGEEKALPALFACALFLLLGCELVYVDDKLGGINARFNTVFKFHFAAWSLFAVASAVTARTAMIDTQPLVRRSTIILTAVSLIAMSVWTVRTAAMRIDRFFHRGAGWSIDGAPYLHKGERAIVDYLRALPAPPVIAEASQKAYSRQGRITVFSGAPGLLVWWNHELTWRGDWTPLGERKNDLEKLFKQGDASVLAKWNVQYVVAGPLEEMVYGAGAGRTIPGMELVLDVDNHRLYRRASE